MTAVIASDSEAIQRSMPAAHAAKNHKVQKPLVGGRNFAFCESLFGVKCIRHEQSKNPLRATPRFIGINFETNDSL
jgi:hypothetical protein